MERIKVPRTFIARSEAISSLTTAGPNSQDEIRMSKFSRKLVPVRRDLAEIPPRRSEF